MTSSGQRPFLLCYDGSADAANAIREVGAMAGGGRARLVHVWVPPSALMFQGREVGEGHPLAPAAKEFDAAAREAAERVTAEGVEVAEAANFDADPLTVASRQRVWRTIVDLADAHRARAVVMGSLGTSKLPSVLVGSVSGGVLNHCRAAGDRGPARGPGARIGAVA
ncbi:MAG TPA: universal stress protein [Solirubrobacterales bacterium]|nr:universal stress protein [Solirubrobacterales bacterium]